jgi:outer membrane translocation and assembly module TamA
LTFEGGFERLTGFRQLWLGKPNGVTILSMRTDVLLGTVLVLATTSVAAQTATGIRLVDVRFIGDTQLNDVDLTKCAADLESQTYEGPEWSGSLTERVRLLCLQDNGYFKAEVKPSTEQLSDKRGTHQFIITFDIDAGPQYRAGEIGFRDNHVFPADELRSMFKLASGDIFSVMKIRQGLNQMHRAYAERHYLNFTVVPGISVDDSRHVISLVFDCDEGKDFRPVNY